VSELQQAVARALPIPLGAQLRHIEDPYTYFDELNVPADVAWTPTYLYDIGGDLWGIDVVRGDMPPDVSEALKVLAFRDDFHIVLCVPDQGTEDLVAPVCQEHGLSMMVWVTDSFELLQFEQAPLQEIQQFVGRFPPVLTDALSRLDSIDVSYRDQLSAFAHRYDETVPRLEPAAADEAQETMVSDLIRAVVAADPRCAVMEEPLRMLRSTELCLDPLRSRDHYFHSVHTFLLGCCALDAMYVAFRDDLAHFFGPGNGSFSPEFAWMLTSLYHDAGYPGAQPAALLRSTLGLAPEGPMDLELQEAVGAWLEAQWNDGRMPAVRTGLCSAWEHLAFDGEAREWGFPDDRVTGDEPFDQMLRESFISGCHGARSAVNLATRIPAFLAREGMPDRHFLQQHLYYSALSILFHDRRVRTIARANNITGLRTSRLPFGALLMFIDAVQDDRREMIDTGTYNDTLTRLTCADGVIFAEVDTERIPEIRLPHRRDEARDIMAFMLQNGIAFRYPPELTEGA
jgi:hypothetical protein